MESHDAVSCFCCGRLAVLKQGEHTGVAQQSAAQRSIVSYLTRPLPFLSLLFSLQRARQPTLQQLFEQCHFPSAQLLPQPVGSAQLFPQLVGSAQLLQQLEGLVPLLQQLEGLVPLLPQPVGSVPPLLLLADSRDSALPQLRLPRSALQQQPPLFGGSPLLPPNNLNKRRPFGSRLNPLNSSKVPLFGVLQLNSNNNNSSSSSSSSSNLNNPYSLTSPTGRRSNLRRLTRTFLPTYSFTWIKSTV
jgi:hypothetical protein